MADNTLQMVLKLSGKDATNTLKKFQRDATGVASAVTSSFNALKTVAAGAMAYLGARQIIRGIESVTEAASIQEDAVNGLNSAMRAAGDFSDEASRDFQNFASQIQSTTKYGDELVLQQLSLAKAFGASNDQAKLVTMAAVELAAATGKSLEEATRQVSKTLGGFAGELGEVNPRIKELTKEQLKAGEAAKVLIEQFGGQAAAAATTFSGKTEQLKNVWGDLNEEIGFAIIQNPTVVSAIGFITDTIKDLINIIKANKDKIAEFVSAAVTAAVAAVKVLMSIDYVELGKSVLILAGAYAGAKGLMAALNGTATAAALASGKMALMFAAVVAAAAAIDLLVRNWSNIGQSLKIADLEQQLYRLEKKAKNMAEGVSVFGLELTKPSEEAAARTNKQIDELKIKLDALKGDSNGPLDFIKKNFDAGFVGEIASTFNGVTDAVDETNKSLKEFKKTATTGIDLPKETGSGFIGLVEGAYNGLIDRMKASAIEWGPIAADAFAKALQGAEGAKALLSTAAGAGAGAAAVSVLGDEGMDDKEKAALAAAFSGPVAEIVGLLAQGPEQAKAMVKEFAESLPDLAVSIIEALAASIDVLIDALIESLIEKGGLERIVVALIKAMPRIAEALILGVPKALLKAMGIDVGVQIYGELKKGMGKLWDGLKQAFTQAFEIGKKAFAIYVWPITTAFDKLKEWMPKWGEDLKAFPANIGREFTQLPEHAKEAGIRMRDGILDGLRSVRQSFIILGEFPKALAQVLGQAAFNIGLKIIESFQSAWSFLKTLPDLLVETLKNVIKTFNAVIFSFMGAMSNVLWDLVGTLAKIPDVLKSAGIAILNAATAALSSFLNGINNAGKTINLEFNRFINSLGTDLRDFISSIGLDLASITPEWVTNFVTDIASTFMSFIDNLFVFGDNLWELITWLPDAIREIFGGDGDRTKNWDRPSKWTLAEGGIIPAGYPNDSYPANLTSGETVIPVRTSDKLFSLIEQLASGGTGGGAVNVTIQVGESELARVMLNLNRRGYRTA